MQRENGLPALLASAIVLFFVSVASGCDQKVASGKADGREVFATACARCHGSGGEPEPGRAARLGVRDLTSPEFQRQVTDDEIRERIVKGSPNGRMPGFGSKLSEQQVERLVAFVRSLAAP